MSRVPAGPSGLLPSSLGLLPWHEVGTRPRWALGAVLGVLPAGADFRSWGPRGSLGQGPPCCCGSFSSGTKAAFTAAAKPGAPQTGLGRLILTERLVSAGGPEGPPGVSVAPHLPGPCLSLEGKLKQLGLRRSKETSFCAVGSSGTAGDILPSGQDVAFLPGWALLSRQGPDHGRCAGWLCGAQGRPARGSKPQAGQPH